MNGNKLSVIVTTIQRPTLCLLKLIEAVRHVGARLLIMGDRKGPPPFHIDDVELFSLADQQKLPFRMAKILPVDHYARKNLGYLLGMTDGAQCIYETDDDNMPTPRWQPRTRTTMARPLAQKGWVNVYQAFTKERIWPRGFPLERVRDSDCSPQVANEAIEVTSPIQQGLADRSPDVDAVWRLVVGDEFHFSHNHSVWLPPESWCSFNSQSTWWWPEAYALLYLPSHCSFRMTDIWRSLVAQRCLWAMGFGLVFHGPEVLQERNLHSLLQDFRAEIPGYLNNALIAECLGKLSLKSGAHSACENLLICYDALIGAGIFVRAEWPLVSAWAADIEACLAVNRSILRAA